jgi:hypothetical protein
VVCVGAIGAPLETLWFFLFFLPSCFFLLLVAHHYKCQMIEKYKYNYRHKIFYYVPLQYVSTYVLLFTIPITWCTIKVCRWLHVIKSGYIKQPHSLGFCLSRLIHVFPYINHHNSLGASQRETINYS